MTTSPQIASPLPVSENPEASKATTPATLPPTSNESLHDNYSLQANYLNKPLVSLHPATFDTTQSSLGQGSPAGASRPSKLRGVHKKRSGHWTPEERRLYLEFIELHRHNFQKKELRRLEKIFKLMSEYIGSRLADQCRSHHQKMEKKYKTLEKILLNEKEHHSVHPPKQASQQHHEPKSTPLALSHPANLRWEEDELYLEHLDDGLLQEQSEGRLRVKKMSIQRTPERAISSEDLEVYSCHSYRDDLEVFHTD